MLQRNRNCRGYYYYYYYYYYYKILFCILRTIVIAITFHGGPANIIEPHWSDVVMELVYAVILLQLHDIRRKHRLPRFAPRTVDQLFQIAASQRRQSHFTQDQKIPKLEKSMTFL